MKTCQSQSELPLADSGTRLILSPAFASRVLIMVPFTGMLPSPTICASPKDQRFVEGVRAIDRPGPVKVIRVTRPQAPRGQFTRAFVEAFQQTDWSAYPNGSDRPA